MDSLTYTQLLRRNRSFRRLWCGQIISELGNAFNLIAALGLGRAVSGSAPEVTTIILLSRLVPFTLFAPLAGAFVDRWSRRTVMIVTDLLRVVVALGFLLVHRPEDLWIAYLCTALLSVFGAFFEAAKSAAVPNITGERDLLAGNALMFSSRFLLISVGSALGGWTSARVGYQIAFIINALSFFASAYSVWLVPEEETRNKSNETVASEPRSVYRGYWSDMREGWSYIVTHAPVATILGINLLWATGGGAMTFIYERLGALVFARKNVISEDSAVAAFFFASGFGLFIGLMIARRVAAFFELRKRTVAFIGWSLLIQGVFFAFAGVMPTLVGACLMVCISRVLLGAEFAVQETLLMRLVPDNLRGRVSTSDRAGEMMIWAFSTAAAGWSLHWVTPRSLTVITGLMSGTAGLLWLVLFVTQRVRLPKKVSGHRYTQMATD
jgi:MFS family permease